MGYKITQKGEKHFVQNTTTGEVMGTHSTRPQAETQLKAITANRSGIKDRIKSTDKFNKKENSAFGHGGEYSTPKMRKEKASPDDFLLPSERKYPYKIAGKISCNLLRSAISRAGQNNESAVEARARALFEKNCQ